MTNIVYIATSLDGYIATPDGGVDWLMDIPNPEGSDFGFAEFMADIDALLMGRKTFEKVLTFGEWIYDKPVFVLSSTLETVPDHLTDKAEVVSGDLLDVVAGLNKRGFKNLYVDGGRLIQGLLAVDAIDTMIITTVSKLLGAGIPLFGTHVGIREFRLEKTEVLGPQMVKNTYRRGA
jgi:dihydrofolate reductase